MKRTVITFLFIISIASAYAAPMYAMESAPQLEFRSQCIITTGATYTSTVYEPFNNTPPSAYSEVGSTQGSSRPGGPRKLGGGTDPGEQSDEFPVGDPWILAVLAVAFAGLIAWRKRTKKAEE